MRCTDWNDSAQVELQRSELLHVAEGVGWPGEELIKGSSLRHRQVTAQEVDRNRQYPQAQKPETSPRPVPSNRLPEGSAILSLHHHHHKSTDCDVRQRLGHNGQQGCDFLQTLLLI